MLTDKLRNRKHDKSNLYKWNNDSNVDFYEHIGKKLQKFAIKGGFEDGCDIDLIYSEIANKTSVIELGASYGRVIKNLLARGYSGELYAIERSVKFYKQLLKQFKSKNVMVINADVKKFIPPVKVDVILMLWSFISEFPKKDQLKILKRLLPWLKPGGVIIMDTIAHNLVPENSSFSKNQIYVIPFKYGNCYGYATSKQEIEKFAKQLKATLIKHIDYKTDTNRDRVLHVLRF